MSSGKKLILVIGATGAQGLAVIDALLRPAADGSPSPYAVRALTRDPQSSRAQNLASKGVELFKGNVDDFQSVLLALHGVYGAFVNTDGAAIGQVKEVFAGIRIFELAKQIGTLQHYVWSNLDNTVTKGNYHPKYYTEHYTGKGRVADWMKVQDSVVSDNGMTWSVLTSGPYMDMLTMPTFGPPKVRADGTYVFASPVGAGHVPMIALEDLTFFARWIFDHRGEASAKDFEVASDWVGWDYLVSTFTKVTGKKAEYAPLTYDDWVELFIGTDHPFVYEHEGSDGTTTWRENFRRWWAMFHDDIVKRDFEWLRSIKPDLLTVEAWMRKNAYTGDINFGLLKNKADGRYSFRWNPERIAMKTEGEQKTKTDGLGFLADLLDTFRSTRAYEGWRSAYRCCSSLMH